jgi:hypothetical protein
MTIEERIIDEPFLKEMEPWHKGASESLSNIDNKEKFMVLVIVGDKVIHHETYQNCSIKQTRKITPQ